MNISEFISSVNGKPATSIAYHERFTALLRIAQSLYRKGHENYVVVPFITKVNTESCQPPLDLDDVLAIAKIAEALADEATVSTGPATPIISETADELLDADIPEPAFAVPGILPEGLTILAGKPKLGKSWLALGIALAVASGGVALGKYPVQAADVLYLALEDQRRRMQDRLSKMLQASNAEPPERLTIATSWPKATDGGLEAIEEWITDQDEPRLVIVDTWPRFRPRRTKGRDLYEEDYEHGAMMKALADKYHLAAVPVCHCRKMDAADPVDMISGTLAFAGSADATLILRRDRSRSDASLFVTGRDLDEKDLALKWDPTYALWTDEGKAEDYKLTKERQAILKLLQQAGEPMTPTNVAAILGKDVSPVKKLLWTMAQAHQLVRDGGKYSAPASGNPSNPVTQPPAEPPVTDPKTDQ